MSKRNQLSPNQPYMANTGLSVQWYAVVDIVVACCSFVTFCSNESFCKHDIWAT